MQMETSCNIELSHLSQGAWRIVYEGPRMMELMQEVQTLGGVQCLESRFSESGSMFLRVSLQPVTEGDVGAMVDFVRAMRIYAGMSVPIALDAQSTRPS